MTRSIRLRWLSASFVACLSCSTPGADTPGPSSTASRTKQETTGTRMLAQPAIHGDQIAFTYLDDLWTSKLDGSGLRRLTSVAGTEDGARFSPDGKTIAFNASYDGNRDVYTIPTSGGEPTRLTWHPGSDVVRDFAPDGKSVLFASRRAVYWRTMRKLYTVSIKGGPARELPIPSAFLASYSEDGTRLAYTPQIPADRAWQNYRGGRTSRIWICNLKSLAVEEVPQPEGRCNDSDPMWVGDTLYFRSDRDGDYNLYVYRNQTVERLTFHRNFSIQNASSSSHGIVYEQAGWLHHFDPQTGKARQLAINVPAEGLGLRPRFAKGDGLIRNARISPSGKRAVFEFRGEIVSLPAKKGNQRNLTHSPGAHERDPAWSPDGQSIAYFSDASGEYKLHLCPSDGQGEEQVLALQGAGFYMNPNWSPDSKKLSYRDNSASLFIIDIESGKCSKVSSEPYYGPSNAIANDWSPDSRWLAYTKGTDALQTTIQLYEVESQSSRAITDGLSLVGDPVFDASGKYLYFTASTDTGRQSTWFAMSNADASSSNEIYLAVLAADTDSPFAPESDEEEMLDSEQEEDLEKADTEPESEDQSDSDEAAETEPMTIDFEGIERRILHLGAQGHSFRNLQTGKEGQLYYLAIAQDSSSTLKLFKLDEGEETVLAQGTGGFSLSADESKLLLFKEGSYQIADAGAPVPEGKGILASASLEVRIDPRQEWKQIFHEAWRINRDYFYDPGMHGVDWPAMREKYSQFLPQLRSRADLNRVLQWMLSELSVGHHYVGGGDLPAGNPNIAGGLLGADFEIHEQRHRVTRVFGGLNWNPGLRSPLSQPGVDVSAGDYLLEINGIELSATDNLHQHLENSVGKTVELRVGPNADASDSRLVRVRPIASEAGLRNRAWVEGNYQRVTEATDGRVAYVHVPDTGGGGHQYFKRYFYPQSDRQALIVDDRHNRGGQVADYVIDIMKRPYLASWATRYGKDYATPHAAILGPKVMLINEHSSSGGDMLPWMFDNQKLGTLVGRRTWGGLVGILGFPVLMDGGLLSAPNIGFWTEQEGFAVENVGVAPHVEVNMFPADCLDGRDPQLERAIEIALQELEANPLSSPKRPAFPIRSKR